MKEKIISIIFVLFLSIFAILNLFIPDTKVSNSERRKMAQFPNITIDNIFSKKSMDDFDKYVVDQFPLRETFKSIDTAVKFNAFYKLDNNDIYMHDGYIIKQEYPLNTNMLNNYINKVNSVCSNYLKGMNVYQVVIPDKNYYVDDNIHLKMNYSKMFNEIKNNILDAKYIDISSILDLEDYYKTDIHWKQENLIPVRNKILKEMGIENIHENNYDTEKYYPFYGSYYGELLSNNVNPDTINYLTNYIIDSAYIDNIENKEVTSVYNEAELSKIDSYSVYLSGPSSIITVYNDKCSSDNELIVFRDSFASSIVPLFIEYYSKITLIDLRYINIKNATNFIEFKNQDVLFMFSTTIINTSNILK